jgi:hypothetical protein
MEKKHLKFVAVAVVALLLLGGLIAFLALRKKPVEEELYKPSVEAPMDFMVIVEYPKDDNDLFSIAALTPLLFQGGTFHPLMILDEQDELSRQEIYTLNHWNTDHPKMLFANDEAVFERVNTQLDAEGLSPVEEQYSFKLDRFACGMFYGFTGAMTAATYEEALWVGTLAKNKNLAVVHGDPTYASQKEVWAELSAMGLPANYIVATNPYDHDLETLKANTPDYDEYDDAWFCPDLSVLSAELSAYYDGYVITRAPPVESVSWVMNMEFSQNRRATGYFNMIRNVSSAYGPAEYVCIVGSASAVPQFLMQLSGQGAITNSDILYGFLDDDHSVMDAALGRVIQYEVSLASNQLCKSFFIDDFVDTVHVNYRDQAGGPQEKVWREHGASFSGYEITYNRIQATPGRWICNDYEDLGWTYDYVGPYGTGNQVLDGVVNSMENNLVEICKGTGYVAYRGHGSDTGSLYGIRVYGPNGDEHKLSYKDCQGMDVPPQVSFFVSCLNGKIYGNGPGVDGTDAVFENLFTMNYLSAGPAVLIGATEVSYSNIGQDIPALRAEYGILSDDHQWDHNDAWYAFVWDGILDHPAEHGTAGKAVQWCENRYMAYPPNGNPCPFEPADTVDWREVTFFTCYGDPAFAPAIPEGTQPGYDPWHNGPNDM